MTAVLPIEAVGPVRRRRGAVFALLLVLAVHAGLVALLASQRSEIRILGAAASAPAAIPVILWPLSSRAPAARRQASAAARPRAPRRREEQGAAPAGAAAPSPGLAQAGQAQPAEPGWPSFGPNLARRIRPRIGCAHPEAYRLSDRERADCDTALGEEAKLAPDLGPNVPVARRAYFDKVLHCRRVEDNPMPVHLHMFDDQEVGPNDARPGKPETPETGGVVSLKDCPPGAQ